VTAGRSGGRDGRLSARHAYDAVPCRLAPDGPTKRYSNEEIYTALGVGNAGGIRPSVGPDGQVRRMAVFTSVPTPRQLVENPYRDRLEGDTLVFTGTGRAGAQAMAGLNARLAEQREALFAVYAFFQVAGRRDKTVGAQRWSFGGLLQYQRGYQEGQLDSHGSMRTVWAFELHLHATPSAVSTERHPGAGARLVDSDHGYDGRGGAVTPHCCSAASAARAKVGTVGWKVA